MCVSSFSSLRTLSRFSPQAIIQCRFSSILNDARFDLVVIGGGSAGLACSKQAAELGAKVALVDAVKPTPHGTVWGIGGACVNVGCIPKKLMHLAALNTELIQDYQQLGWEGVHNVRVKWSKLVDVVQDRIKTLNWIYQGQLKQKNVQYINGFANFLDPHTIRIASAGGKKFEQTIRGENFLIAAGLRPRYPDIPGSYHCITSDDLFSLKREPEKTLVVGSGYVGLECASLLQSLCGNTHLMVRSIPLRGFDQHCAELLLSNMAARGLNVLRYVIPTEIKKLENGRLNVAYRSVDGTATTDSDDYDTVVWAVGREPQLSLLKTDNAGIKIGKSGKIVVDKYDKTSTDHIYAIGDNAEGRPELPSPAIKAGQLLAKRLFGSSHRIMNYETIPTTVFTSLEYSAVGLSEEAAIDRFGADNVEVFHTYYEPYEYMLRRTEKGNLCYAKVIVKRWPQEKVLGIHFMGPNAAEVIQGFAAAIRANISKEQLFDTIPIHPCSAEEIVKMTETKRSGTNPMVHDCCG